MCTIFCFFCLFSPQNVSKLSHVFNDHLAGPLGQTALPRQAREMLYGAVQKIKQHTPAHLAQCQRNVLRVVGGGGVDCHECAGRVASQNGDKLTVTKYINFMPVARAPQHKSSISAASVCTWASLGHPTVGVRRLR